MLNEKPTGLFDLNHKEIFEGDILDTHNSTMDIKVRVVWDQDNARFAVDFINGGRYGDLTKKLAANWEIVG